MIGARFEWHVLHVLLWPLFA